MSWCYGDINVPFNCQLFSHSFHTVYTSHTSTHPSLSTLLVCYSSQQVKNKSQRKRSQSSFLVSSGNLLRLTGNTETRAVSHCITRRKNERKCRCRRIPIVAPSCSLYLAPCNSVCINGCEMDRNRVRIPI